MSVKDTGGASGAIKGEEVRVDEILILQRRPRSMGRVGDLAESMRINGQLQPVVVRHIEPDPQGRIYELVAGKHRVSAAKLLEWETVRAEVRTLDDIEAEAATIAENLHRKELEVHERALHVRRYYELTYSANMMKSGTQGGRPRKNPETVSGLKTVSDLAGDAGVSDRHFRNLRRLAERIPEPHMKQAAKAGIGDSYWQLEKLSRKSIPEQREILIELRVGGKAKTVDDAERWIARRDTGHLAESVEPVVHKEQSVKYKTVVVDPPWAGHISGDINPFGKLAPAYATMSYEEIANTVKEILDEHADPEDCHLYLWVPSRVILKSDPEGMVESWGFETKQLLTWRKSRPGAGRYYRNQDEHVIFAMRGTRLLKTQDYTTIFDGERTTHSRKPDSFYRMVWECSDGPALDLFQREGRDKFDGWGTLEGVKETRKAV